MIYQYFVLNLLTSTNSISSILSKRMVFEHKMLCIHSTLSLFILVVFSIDNWLILNSILIQSLFILGLFWFEEIYVEVPHTKIIFLSFLLSYISTISFFVFSISISIVTIPWYCFFLLFSYDFIFKSIIHNTCELLLTQSDDPNSPKSSPTVTCL